MRAILTLHSVDHSRSAMSITPAQLRSLLRSIRRSGHRIVGLRELLENPAEDHRIALTFDDGIASVHEHAMPILAEQDAPATIFIVSDHVGRDTRWPSLPAGNSHFPTMSWNQVEELFAAGWDIQAHTATHPFLPRLSRAEIEEEMAKCDDALEARLGKRPRLLAYPYGSVDPGVAEIASHRYDFSLTARMANLPAQINQPQLVPRLEVYFFRSEAVHHRFASPSFRAYLAARAAIRRLRQG